MPKKALEQKQVDQIEKLLKAGKTYSAVAEAVGAHKMTIAKYAKQLGLAKGGKGGRPKNGAKTNGKAKPAAKKVGRPRKVAAKPVPQGPGVVVSQRDIAYLDWVQAGRAAGFIIET